MLTLAITTSTTMVGVAIGTSSQVFACNEIVTDRRHCEELTPLIELTMHEASKSVSQLERIAIDIGPGRFTGLRVGVATAKTLAFAAKIPLVPITSLQALASGVSEDTRHIAAVVDARRGEVFQQLFSDGVAQQEPSVGSPHLVEQTDVVYVGDGAETYSETYGEFLISGCHPSAEAMLKLAEVRSVIEFDFVQPLYLRDPDAVPNIKTRQNS